MNTKAHDSSDLSEGFDPKMLIEAALRQATALTWLPEALANCGVGTWESRAYVHYVEDADKSKPGSPWQFEKSVVLSHESLGMVVLDVLSEDRLGGIEFVDRIGEQDESTSS